MLCTVTTVAEGLPEDDTAAEGDTHDLEGDREGVVLGVVDTLADRETDAVTHALDEELAKLLPERLPEGLPEGDVTAEGDTSDLEGDDDGVARCDVDVLAEREADTVTHELADKEAQVLGVRNTEPVLLDVAHAVGDADTVCERLPEVVAEGHRDTELVRDSDL